MIIAWLAYCLLVSLLIGCAALAAEYGLRLYQPNASLGVGGRYARLPGAARCSLPAPDNFVVAA